LLLLGHVGITLGAATLLARALPDAPSRAATANAQAAPEGPTSANGGLASWFVRLGHGRDIRLLLLGSLLPDIIDKPLGQVLLRESLANGRIYSHTLLFLLLLSLIGLVLLRRRRQNGALLVAFGVLAHLVLDQMWWTPQTLLWPLYGLEFPRVFLPGWLERLLYSLQHDPAVFVPEAVGAAVLASFLWVLLRTHSLGSFTRTGHLRG
jgi:membrane-bound metal-dependent hydrolase YbcI (DUF457 family)